MLTFLNQSKPNRIGIALVSDSEPTYDRTYKIRAVDAELPENRTQLRPPPAASTCEIDPCRRRRPLPCRPTFPGAAVPRSSWTQTAASATARTRPPPGPRTAKAWSSRCVLRAPRPAGPLPVLRPLGRRPRREPAFGPIRRSAVAA
jgi:hypothetical protein